MVDGINSFNVSGHEGGTRNVNQRSSSYQKKLNSLFGGQKLAAASQVNQQSNLSRIEGAVTKNDKLQEGEPSDAKIITENFKNEVMSKLDTSTSKRSVKSIEYYLNKLLSTVQTLNGVQKNKLTPQGTSEQNEIYNKRMKEIQVQMLDYAEFVGSGLSVVQDSKTGLYKLKINNELLYVPDRKVEIVPEETLDRTELLPKIVD